MAGERPWPGTCDVLVVGGGAVGSSAAYHLKERARDDLSVVVVEQDSTVRIHIGFSGKTHSIISSKSGSIYPCGLMMCVCVNRYLDK